MTSYPHTVVRVAPLRLPLWLRAIEREVPTLADLAWNTGEADDTIPVGSFLAIAVFIDEVARAEGRRHLPHYPHLPQSGKVLWVPANLPEPHFFALPKGDMLSMVASTAGLIRELELARERLESRIGGMPTVGIDSPPRLVFDPNDKPTSIRSVWAALYFAALRSREATTPMYGFFGGDVTIGPFEEDE